MGKNKTSAGPAKDLRTLVEKTYLGKKRGQREAFLEANQEKCSICQDKKMEAKDIEDFKQGKKLPEGSWFAYTFLSPQQKAKQSDGENWRLVCGKCNNDSREYKKATPNINQYLVMSICQSVKKTKDEAGAKHGKTSDEFRKWVEILKGTDNDVQDEIDKRSQAGDFGDPPDEKAKEVAINKAKKERKNKRNALVGRFVKDAIEEKLERARTKMEEHMVSRILQLSVDEGDWVELLEGALDSDLGETYRVFEEIKTHLEHVRVASEAIKKLEVRLKGPDEVAKEIVITAVEKLRQHPDHLGSEFVIFEQGESGKVLIERLPPGDSETVKEVPFEETVPFVIREE